jgi:hypothetical protein
MNVDSKELDSIFRTVGTSRGYEAEAAFAANKEFKSCWWRWGHSVRFEVSDYLRGAPKSVVDSFARTLFDRVGCKAAPIFTAELRSYLESEEFLVAKQPLYIKRSRNITRSAAGHKYDLNALLDSLVDQGLVKRPPSAYLTWTSKPNTARVGYCSVLMNVVCVSSALDRESVPSYVPEYVLYHELLHLEDGLREGERHHGPVFCAKERRHPMWAEAETMLRRIHAMGVA